MSLPANLGRRRPGQKLQRMSDVAVRGSLPLKGLTFMLSGVAAKQAVARVVQDLGGRVLASLPARTVRAESLAYTAYWVRRASPRAGSVARRASRTASARG